MAPPFSKYCLTRDRYCVAYFGFSDEYLVQLAMIKPAVEEALPGLKMFICHRDGVDAVPWCDDTISRSDLLADKNAFGYIREIRCDTKRHPVLALLEESGIPCPRYDLKPANSPTCVIIPSGVLPTVSMNTTEIATAARRARRYGYEVEVDGPIDNASWVVGVESPGLFNAIRKGVKTTLVETGLGTKLYRGFRPDGEVWRP